MAFYKSAKRELRRMEPGSFDHVILEYLLANAVGVANAKPWSAIARHLAAHGFTKARVQRFQQGLLKRSREGEIFIGSSDACGYYIIKTWEDGHVMAKWYDARIKKEEARLKRIAALMCLEWPVEYRHELKRMAPQPDHK